MSSENIPVGWLTTYVGELVAPKVEKGAPNGDDDFCYIDISSVDNQTKKITAPKLIEVKKAPSRARQHIQRNDVLVSMTRPNLNAVALVANKYDGAIASTGFDVLRPIEIDPRWLFSHVRSRRFVEEMSLLVQGALYPAVKSKEVRSNSIPLPPLGEQRRIADKIDVLQTKSRIAREALEATKPLLDKFRQSVLAAAFRGDLTAEWRKQNPDVTPADKVVSVQEEKRTGKFKIRGKNKWESVLELPQLPNGWAWIHNFRLAQDKLNAICAGPFGTIFKAKDFRDEGVPIIFLRHVKMEGFNQNKPNFMDPDVWEEFHQPYSINGGELLVTKLGDPPGESCIYPNDCGVSMVTPDVIKMDVDEGCCFTEYLMHFFNSPTSKGLIKELAFGATRLRINIPMFRYFPIPLAPVEEQAEIVRLLRQQFKLLDSIENKILEGSSSLDSLDQSILAKAFRGELVPQDPNDEPASVLLERIKTEREAAKGKKKRRRKKG
ncbi:Type I restriction enzyme specificity protein [Pseudodesulfovibrio profundus]|uniref:Type I restriction enzyme specificity protein n=1 Tax=Pseudodesulfovibrio profundus TaxID=57320 RepID=A0A2C8F6A3_9BACT|nr:restriction endonuclease subunit S [Pseudodesulfovibrio profundus]SOB57924.1 Type I restriction enzyme specificity protein [Pseudodesulfovibrio profundus]